jgi:hypothetical protein
MTHSSPVAVSRDNQEMLQAAIATPIHFRSGFSRPNQAVSDQGSSGGIPGR